MNIAPDELRDNPYVIEAVEKASTRMVCQALWDFVPVAVEIFARARDLAGTVGEDVTRDDMDSMGVHRIPAARLIGKIDYKRAAYYFDPEYSLRQALFVDSKAEKGDESSATIQTSQTSMRIRMYRRGRSLDEPGKLEPVVSLGPEKYLTTTLFVKYIYHVLPSQDNRLLTVIIACVPNGLLQDLYNPSAEDTIWRSGRDAPSRDEEFRVRIHFARLMAKKRWRVQFIRCDPTRRFEWVE